MASSQTVSRNAVGHIEDRRPILPSRHYEALVAEELRQLFLCGDHRGEGASRIVSSTPRNVSFAVNFILVIVILRTSILDFSQLNSLHGGWSVRKGFMLEIHASIPAVC